MVLVNMPPVDHVCYYFGRRLACTARRAQSKTELLYQTKIIWNDISQGVIQMLYDGMP